MKHKNINIHIPEWHKNIVRKLVNASKGGDFTKASQVFKDLGIE